jgi:subtilisin family serine protease
LKNVLVVIAVLLIISMAAASVGPALAASSREKDGVAGKPDGKAGLVRVIAESEEKASEAVAKGCNTVRETKGLKAMLCKSETASILDLKEDILLYKTDTGANLQIGAKSVHSASDTGAGRKIVVLDTGYNYNHPDLASSYLGGRDFVNNDKDPMDDNGHGSHVSGLITSDGLDDPATRGAAPDTGIIAGKVLDSGGAGYFSDVVAGVYWALDGPDGRAGTADDFNADAISMSLASLPPYVYKYHCNSEIPSMTKAIRYALERGVTVVVAAGNSGSQGVGIPGCISYSTTVGAVDGNDKVASFSGRGKGVDISAPGVQLTSTWLGTSQRTLSGTSMATPLVSATVALVKYDHPSYSPSQVQAALFETAKDLGKVGKDWSYGYGRVEASAAVAY